MAYEGPHPFPITSGGTADTSFTAFSVVCGGVTATAPLQNVSGVGTSSQVLTSNGPGVLPTWQAASGGSGFTTINIQAFSSSGTYTPTAGMKYCIVEAWGGGGAGGGANTIGDGGGGGAGGYSRGVFSAATIGASKPVTIGTGGTGISGGTGNAGGNTTFGLLLTANGGNGGSANAIGAAGGTGGTASGGTVNITGASGSTSGLSTSGFSQGGYGASSMVGGGGPSIAVATGAATGSAATGFASGGGGGVVTISGTTAGGAGAKGFVIVTEFV